MGLKARTLSYIDRIYARLGTLSWFVVRDSQVAFSKKVAEAFLDGVPLCVEAPTGTGKTLAYLIGSWAASKAEEAQSEGEIKRRIVVSTATVSLQEQVLDSDLETLHKAKVIPRDAVILAKGRGRYFCPLNGARESGIGSSDQGSLFGEEGYSPEIQEARDLFRTWDSGDWPGDVDTLDNGRPVLWSKLQASRDTCHRRFCRFSSRCPFYRARDKLKEARIVIANHSLVLADLRLLDEGAGAAVIPEIDQALLIFDEGHHLPDKAMAVAATEIGRSQAQEAARSVVGLAKPLSSIGSLDPALQARWTSSLRRNDLAGALGEVFQQATPVEMPEDRTLIQPELPEALTKALEAAVKTGWKTHYLLRDIHSGLESLLEAGDSSVQNVLAEVAMARSRVERIVTGFVSYQNEAPDKVRWLSFHEKERRVEPVFHTSPIEGDGALRRYLWLQTGTVLVTSATLRSLGSFSRFRFRSGIPNHARYHVVPPTFPYNRSRMIVPKLDTDPTSDRFEDEVVAKLEEIVDPGEGTLILFTSYGLMRRCIERLSEGLRERVLMQGSGSRSLLISRHKARIDKGEGSILVGVDSFAEGLDLPGDYCTHLILTRLPFSVPTEPVEQARLELAGDLYFMRNMLPDASLKLTQAVGRLLRRETDQGRITVLDKRLVTKRYGSLLLKNLPPFSRVFACEA